MKLLFFVGVGGFIGSILRYTLYLNFNKIVYYNFPIGTFIINVVGCFIIGILVNSGIIKAEKIPYNEFFIIGILGGFTTFSAFGMETYNLIKENLLLTAFLYVFSSILVGLFSIYISSKFYNNI